MTNEQPRLTIDKRSPALWVVTFANPPINLIDTAMIGELQHLLTAAETDDRLAVIVFDSADPEFFLAHWDVADTALKDGLPPGPTGMHPWLDEMVRLSRLPQVTIAAPRGWARGAGSEFALAADIRFASTQFDCRREDRQHSRLSGRTGSFGANDVRCHHVNGAATTLTPATELRSA
jgi:enoyl-CoA hydratase/carnithine racemase